jgi:DNA polymerase-3 subunit gamma/tau
VAEQPAYVAIARKWRPLTLEEMVGQTHVTRTLKNALASGRIHHAFLFTGARGVGKTTAARALARALECVEGPTASPCGSCGPCVDILAGSCPDVVEVDGASNNSVEDIRDLRDGVRYLPATARFRIYIIDEVHMLSKGAFNALLKTLEEPPPHVKFIFATTEVNKIPETILSRVQRFDFKRIAASVVVSRLRLICEAEGIALSEAALRMVARAGEGSMRDAQSLLDQVISFGGADPTDAQVADILGMVDRGVLYEMLTGLVRGEPDRCLDAIAQVHDHGYEMAQFTGELLELVRNAALVGLSPGARKHLDVPEEEKERLAGLVEGMAPEQLSRVFQVLLEVHDQVARASRPRMVLEMAVARLVSVRPAIPIAPLVDRLVDLERRLRAGGASVAPARGGARGREPTDDPEGER